jgi:hypothetical protein
MLLRIALAAVVAGCPLAWAEPPAHRLQGFGATTPGGDGQPNYRVTALADSGLGTLREAISLGRRRVVFDVAGDIILSSPLFVGGPFITIDGSTAPPPGITLRGYGLVIRGQQVSGRPGGAHDVIVRSLRIRDAVGAPSTDCIQIAWGAYNVVIDRVSAQGCADGVIDITNGAHDVTVSWSILAAPRGGKTMLVSAGASRVTLHHNLFIKGRSRNPAVTRAPDARATEITVDMRNNVVWDWGPGYGTLVRYGAWANLVSNVYGNPGGGLNDRRQALIVCPGPAGALEAHALCGRGDPASAARGYAHGNVSADGVNLGAAGNEATPFPVSPVDTTDACTAVHQVLAGAGARPLDGTDQRYVESVEIPSCPERRDGSSPSL